METQDSKTKINWTIVIIVGVCIVGLLGWEYIKTIQDKNDIERDRLSQEQKSRDEETARIESEKIERENNLSSCLSTAMLNYSYNWDNSCKTLSTKNQESHDNCIATSSLSASFCDRMWPDIPTTNCSLPTDTADRWDSMKESENQHCYDMYGSN